MLRVLEVVIPSLGATLFFVIGVRALIQADRRERIAAARLQREREPVAAAGPDAAPASEATAGTGTPVRGETATRSANPADDR